jgi:sterol desaturase/sphingolipid hydroxylase (fatty acid hydroxylase superfamily)
MGAAWSAFVKLEPQGAYVSFLENFGLYVAIYPASFLVVHKVLPKVLAPFKYDVSPPDTSIVKKEIRRSLVGVLIATGWDALLQYCGAFAPEHAEVTMSRAALWSFLMYAWGDFHFYWQHRVMHSERLYRFHKVHHESRNPNVFSGLSFHPLESSIYFSAMLLPFAAPIPFWAHRLLRLGLIAAPLPGHIGHGPEVADWHFVHHKTTNFNFGGTPLWDVLFGTYYGLGEFWRK